MKTLRTFIAILALVVGVTLVGETAVAQVSSNIWIAVTNNIGETDTIYFGVNPNASNGIDDGSSATTDLGEFELPPLPPSSVYDVRWTGHDAGTNLGNGTRTHLRPYLNSTQRDTFQISFQAGATTNYPVTISWPAMSQYFGTATIESPISGPTNMITNSSFAISQTFLTTALIITQSPMAPAAGISTSPCPLNMGIVSLPSPGTKTDSITITNNGASAEQIDSVRSSDAAFVVDDFNGSLAGGASAKVGVVFTAPGAGSFSSIITVYFAGSDSTVCSVNATASSGEGIYFLTTENQIYDNQDNYSEYVGLKYSGADSIQGVQFTVNVPNNYLQFNNVQLGPSITDPFNWSFDYEISTAASGSEIQIVLFGQDNTINFKAGTYDSVFVISYDTKDVASCDNAPGGDSVIALAYLSDVQSVLADNLGTPAGLTADPNRDTAQFFIHNSSSRGDVNCDDRVNVLDVLEIIDVVLERSTFEAWQFNRADLAPWSAVWASGAVFDDATNYGDAALNIQDIVLVVNAILNEQWPDNGPLWGTRQGDDDSKGGASSTASVYDVKFTYEVDGNGIDVRMNNLLPVKGAQMKLRADGNTNELEVIINQAVAAGFTVNDKVVDGEIRLVLYSLSGNSIAPGNNLLMSLPFTLVNPSLVKVIEPIIAGGENNEALKVEYQVLPKTSAVPVPGNSLAKSLELVAVPNPFGTTTTISYNLPSNMDVTLVVTDAAGKEVARLVEGERQVAGQHSVEFNGAAFPAGTYFYTVTANGLTVSQKMVLTR